MHFSRLITRSVPMNPHYHRVPFICGSRKCTELQADRPHRHSDRSAVERQSRLHELHGSCGEPVHLHADKRQAVLPRIQLLHGCRPGRAQRGQRRPVLYSQKRQPHRHGSQLCRQVLLLFDIPDQLAARVIHNLLLLV